MWMLLILATLALGMQAFRQHKAIETLMKEDGHPKNDPRHRTEWDQTEAVR